MTAYGCDEMYKKLHRRKPTMRTNSRFISTKDEKNSHAIWYCQQDINRPICCLLYHNIADMSTIKLAGQCRTLYVSKDRLQYLHQNSSNLFNNKLLAVTDIKAGFVGTFNSHALYVVYFSVACFIDNKTFYI